ncbi:MAG: MFS transporter, partial [Lachnospiraceae bacterium]|nr:MFS transporter [Lachnospiraceae bacterium]
MNEKNKVRLWTMPFIMLIIVNVFNATAGQMTFPLVADFARSLGAKLTVASSIAGLMSLAALFVCPVAGVISDYLPKKAILSVSSICYAVFLFLHAFCTSIPMLIFLRLVTGIFFSIINVTVVAYSSAFIAKERLGEGLGYAGLANILTQALGPAISLSLEKTFGFYAVFYAAGACALFAFLLLFAMPKGNETQNEIMPKKKLTLSNIFAWDYTIFMLLAVLFAACSSMILTYLKIIADERSIEGIALFFTVYSIAMVIM